MRARRHTLSRIASCGLVLAAVLWPLPHDRPVQASSDGLDIAIGRALFKRPWVPGPASTQADDGLGPLFDARSCASCHPRDGRASASFDAQGHLDGRGVVLMIARPDGSGDPVYGRRLQIDAAPGFRPEGVIGASDTALPDGRRARRPLIEDLGYGPLDPASGLSLRVAPDLRGRGAIAQVSDETIRAVAAEQAAGAARRKDGVAGRPRILASPSGGSVVGRFGWKASHADISHQSAEAFLLDLGLSTTIFPEPWGDCTEVQTACRAGPHGNYASLPGSPVVESRDVVGGVPEISDALLSRVVAYVAALPVPAPIRADPGSGARLFAATGCAECHRPTLAGAQGPVRLFSDLLLHEMGPDLGDTMPEPGAGTSEWRTAPLAGISEALARDTGLLHDGRARNVEEAVRWHGGEAAEAARRFSRLSATDRAALLRYVSSL